MALLRIGVLLALSIRTLAATTAQFGNTMVHGMSYPTLGQEFFGGKRALTCPCVKRRSRAVRL